MSSPNDPDNPFGAFANPFPPPSAVARYLERKEAERRRSRWHWLARRLIFVGALTVSVVVQSVCEWRGFPGLAEILARTAAQAALGGLVGTGLALVLLLFSGVLYQHRDAAHYETVNAWLFAFPVILTIVWSAGIFVGAFWPFVRTLL
jgi:hypothetical protein